MIVIVIVLTVAVLWLMRIVFLLRDMVYATRHALNQHQHHIQDRMFGLKNFEIEASKPVFDDDFYEEHKEYKHAGMVEYEKENKEARQ